MSARLREQVRDHLSASRIERQWAGLQEAGLPGPARRGVRRMGLVTAAVLGMSASALLVFFLRTPQAVPAGALVESTLHEVGMRLEDGSRAYLQPHTRIALLQNEPRDIEIELREGSMRFDVTHVRGRRFRVKAGSAEASVVGTRFSIARVQRDAALLVRVAVNEGVVEVSRHDGEQGETRRIRAGESWSALIPNPQRQQEPVATQTVIPAAAPAPLPGVVEPIVAPKPLVKRTDEITERPIERTALEVFKQAGVARRAGRMREAAEAYKELVDRFPRDARAGLCAFELGRIRMDALSDDQGAIEALERSLQTGPSASYHEDAIARIVVANDALGITEACRRARMRYLASYPTGVHAHALLVRCR